MLPPLEARTSARCVTFRRGGRQSTLQQMAQPSAIRTQCVEKHLLHRWVETEKARVQPLGVLGREWQQLFPSLFANSWLVPPLSLTERRLRSVEPRSTTPQRM